MTVADTTPYPWPYHGAIRADRTALVVCGAGATWSSRTPLDPAVEAAIAALRSAAAAHTMPVILIHHAPLGHRRPVVDLPTEPSPVLSAGPDEVVVQAAGIDGFHGSPLDVVLHGRGVTDLLMVGRGLATCVHSTTRRANDRGYECLTVADACASINPSCRAGAISSIEFSGGIFGAVGSTDAVLDALSTARPATAAPPTKERP